MAPGPRASARSEPREGGRDRRRDCGAGGRGDPRRRDQPGPGRRCTVGIGTVAGHVANNDRVGLIYFDLHADLNIPASVLPGTLDWMGMAHMLGVDGAAD